MIKKISEKIEEVRVISKSNLDFRKIALRGALLALAGVIISFILFPLAIKFMIKKQVTLKPGSEMREIWTKTPFPVNFYIYVFNVTNPDEVTEGQKPNVQEIGPYYFTEWKEKYDLEDDDEEDSVTFQMRNTFIFQPDRSNGLTGEELITIPHLLLQGIALFTNRQRPSILSLIAKGLELMFPLKNPFLTAKFMDIFFRGILVDCSIEDIAVNGIRSGFHSGAVKGTRVVNETHFSFSIFGTANGSSLGKFTVLRGIKNISDLGRVIRVDDKPKLDAWNGDECNTLFGTDSTIFPPFLRKDQGLWSYAPELCRSFGAWFDRRSKYDGISTLRYTMDLGNIKADTKQHCFCKDPPDGCLPKGTIDLFPCMHAPLIGSLPHFYHGDRGLLENVSGLNPNTEQHDVFIEFYSLSGSTLSAAKRLQFNLAMEPLKQVELMHNLPRVIMPLFWVEESLYLNRTWTQMLKNTLILGLQVNLFIKIIFTTIGLIVAITAGYFYWKKAQKAAIVNVLTAESAEKMNRESRTTKP